MTTTDDYRDAATEEMTEIEQLRAEVRQLREALAGVLLEPAKRLTRDMAQAARILSPDEARYLVDAYYIIQDNRKASKNQVRALGESSEPHSVIEWLASQNMSLESQIQRALDHWTDGNPVGIWAKSITGIGPVISAGLLAHIDITQAPTVGHIWRFAGLDPTRTWIGKEASKEIVAEVVAAHPNVTPDQLLELIAEREARSLEKLRTAAYWKPGGEKTKIERKDVVAALAKRPWNSGLKTLCWKIGQSFMKFHNHPTDFYGQLYVSRKAFEMGRNDRGELADQAAAALVKKKIGRDTEAYGHYSEGRLPPAHIDARARRWTVKLFLAHFQTVAYVVHYEKMPPLPYVISVLGHADMITVPNAHLVPGLRY